MKHLPRLALAAGLAQVMDQQRYREIIMTRATVSVGEDIGFLPGTEEEKMTPWMGALTDNLEVLANPEDGGSWGRQATNDLLASRIKIRSLNFMRGRTFLSRYLILDEQGPDHNKCFKMAAECAGFRFAPAWGKNKKDAELRAAENALAEINGDPVPHPTS